MTRFAGLLACALALLAASARAADVDPGAVDWLQSQGISVPDTGGIVVCHGFGCRWQTEVALSRSDMAHMAQVLAPGRTSAAAERQALSRLIAWFEVRIAPETGTAHAVARPNLTSLAGQPSQFDCIDTATNMTSLFLILDQAGLLRHHAVERPVSRHFFIDGIPHTTAVLLDRATGERWAVDPWTHNNGEQPDVLPLEEWSRQD